MVKLASAVCALIAVSSCLTLPTQCSTSAACGSGSYCDCEGFCRPVGSDASLTGCGDAGVAPPDAGPDAGADAGLDAGVDAGMDAGSDAGVDGGGPPSLDGGPCHVLDLAPARYNLAITPWSNGSQSGFLLLGGVGGVGCLDSTAVTYFQTSGQQPSYQPFSSSRVLSYGAAAASAVFAAQTPFLFGGKYSGATGQPVLSVQYLTAATSNLWIPNPQDIDGSAFIGTYGESAVVTGSTFTGGNTDLFMSLVGGDEGGLSLAQTLEIVVSSDSTAWDFDCVNVDCAGPTGLIPREFFGLEALSDGTLMAIGGAQFQSSGTTGANATLDSAQSLAPMGNAWDTAPSLNHARGYLVTAIDSAQTIYAIGGAGPTDAGSGAIEASGQDDTMETLTLDAGSWQLATNHLPNGGRMGAVGAYDENTSAIYVFMGLVNGVSDNGYDIYSVDAGTWQNCLADGGCVTCAASGLCPTH